MGSYLSKPKLEKFSEDFECNGKYECGLSGMQGWRSSMEDSHNCIPKLTENCGFFAVYDGHGGSEVATFCAMHLPTMLKESPEYQKKDYEEALRKTFLNIDAQILEPEAQKELKILTTYEPSGKLPTESDLKKLEAEQSLNEDDEEEEARLLQEEAHMNIEDVLKRYQQDNLVASTVKAEEENPSGSSGSSASPRKSSSSSSALKEEEHKVEQVKSEKSEEKESEQVKSDENNIEKKEEEQKEETKKETQLEGSVETKKNVDNSGDNNGEVAEKKEEEPSKSSNGESSVEASSSSSKIPLKKLVKMKTPKRSAQKGSLQGINDDDPDDEDYLSDDDSELDDDDDSDDDDSEIDDDDIDGEDNVNASLFEFLKNQPHGMIEVPGIDSGTTACVALLCDKKLYVANAGDSRCVISRSGGVVHEMSEDHKPEDEIELNRIRKAGGHVNEQGRVNGGLNLSRAIGDHCYKKNEDLSLEEQMISSLPDISCVELKSDDEFMVIACDGIWNVMTSQEVVDFVRQRLMSRDEEPKQKISEICEELFEKCIAPDTAGDGTGCDNMTAVIVQFQSSWLRKSAANNAEDATTATPSNATNGVDKKTSETCSESRKRSSTGEEPTDAKLVKTD